MKKTIKELLSSNDMKTPKQAVAFVRVTHKQQAQKGYSLADQKAKIDQFAEHNYFRIQTYFMCIGKISTEQLDEILTHCKAHTEIKTLIVQNTARLSRDYGYFMYFKSVLARHGVEIVTTDQSNTHGNDPMGRFMDSLQLLLGQLESEQRSMRVKEGLAKRKQQRNSMELLG